ncbi:DUF421 domain-containing protein [Salinisphaera orenii]|uniref:Membrane protein n=1 Tax=Salinisphaera orenii YIM 95161 TaxID=1051139 RepID=A0A423PU53_9GAMM|nr:YetF domain-containing protein [Salinisphaera halophila]ROO29145.1 membrane protein [Salinisphaera halophila YIM 95161]
MNQSSWLAGDLGSLIGVVVSGLVIYAALMLFTRLVGLRSFSKMSGFDFAITVALGSVIASTLLNDKPPLVTGIVGLAVLYGIQYKIARLRRSWPAFARLIDNEPLLLMAGERILDDHLTMARVTRDDLRAKLRLAGVTHPSQVLAVVMETTGDVAVIERRESVDPDLFSGVRGRELLAGVLAEQPTFDARRQTSRSA